MKVLMIVCGILLGGVILYAGDDGGDEAQEVKSADGDQYLSKEYLEQINSQRQSEEYEAQLENKRQEKIMNRISNIR